VVRVRVRVWVRVRVRVRAYRVEGQQLEQLLLGGLTLLLLRRKARSPG
jgi:hypothetical protein